MQFVTLIGFPDDLADAMAAGFASEGYRVNRKWNLSDLRPDATATLICADDSGWRETIAKVRALYPRMFLIAATRLPDHETWLDALEAGADDYLCTPLEPRQLRWLFRLDNQYPQSANAVIACA